VVGGEKLNQLSLKRGSNILKIWGPSYSIPKELLVGIEAFAHAAVNGLNPLEAMIARLIFLMPIISTTLNATLDLV
jgi:hypothetical protein